MGEQGRDILYYDGSCPICRGSTRLLRALDWLGRLDFRDQNVMPDAALPVSRETAERGVPMRTRDGRALVGFPAMRRALLQTPLGSLPALGMYAPGGRQLGRWVYGRVASERHRDGCQACASGSGGGSDGDGQSG